ncbi:hypothetical protein CASFOL_002823 [Castilleja foliolosa]|uniref:Uncharacterized protein n=1 Tax=Castilleja foliolosa TaxID=1961234 RepID=A0ABD3EFU0_9LAMI
MEAGTGDGGQNHPSDQPDTPAQQAMPVLCLFREKVYIDKVGKLKAEYKKAMEEYNEVEEYKFGTMHFMVCGLQLYLLLRGRVD